MIVITTIATGKHLKAQASARQTAILNFVGRLFQIQLELDLAGFRNSYLASAGTVIGFGENLFSDHRTVNA